MQWRAAEQAVREDQLHTRSRYVDVGGNRKLLSGKALDGSVWRSEAAAYIQARQLTTLSHQQDGSWRSRSRTCDWCVRVPISSGGVHLVTAAHSPRQVA